VTHVESTTLDLRGQRFEPVIVALGWTSDLYRSVTISIAPGRRVSCIVGPRGATDEEACESALALVAHISP
jgi:hypothetical protein